MSPGAAFGISLSFPRFSPPSGQVAHVFLALPPLSPADIAAFRTGRHCCLPDPVRLACLIHAASVRSEPESNSQKKNLSFLVGAPRGAPGITTSFPCSLCSASLPKAPSRGARDRVLFSTVLVSRIDCAPFGRNGWVIYQNGPPGARGVTEDFSSFSGARKTQWNQAFRPH